MPKEAVNLGGVEHRDWHNLYGIYMQMATAQGQLRREAALPEDMKLRVPLTAVDSHANSAEQQLVPLLHNPLLGGGQGISLAAAQALLPAAAGYGYSPRRPFVLTRSFWAGSQRHGALWTGDNRATWGHYRAAQPMLLAIGAAGLAFAGADVGGFFGEPEGRGEDDKAELFLRWYQGKQGWPLMLLTTTQCHDD